MNWNKYLFISEAPKNYSSNLITVLVMSFVTFLYFRLQAIFLRAKKRVMLKSMKVLNVQVTDNLIFL